MLSSINYRGTDTKKNLEEGRNIQSQKRHHCPYHKIKKMMRKRKRRK
jgi:hypothetical protein